MSHVLVVGGTGMLKGAVLYLARHANSVSVVARTTTRLEPLRQEAARLTGGDAIDPIAVDYHDSAVLRAKLFDAVNRLGPVTLAVCWIHSTAPQAPLVIAEAVGQSPQVCRFFHVFGSARSDPRHESLTWEAKFQRFAGIHYRRIILGFILEGRSVRWLTDDEICNGVIRAIDSDQPESVVGTLHPWSTHP